VHGTTARPPPPAAEDEVQAARRLAVIETPQGPLYAPRVRVYPRKVRGTYRSIKWAVLAACLAVYYLVPWLRWDRGPGAPDQAVLIDMPGRRAYFFWIEIWPQEVYFLTGLLILGAVGLFLATSLFGRVWCGYACPQTVWTDLFMLVERWIEGDRNARIKLDRAPWSAAKLGRKAAKHAVWLTIAAATGGAWVLYFQDAPTALVEIFSLKASATTYLFIALFTATTYTLAGWAREQVCTYMCPWPRFQAAMQDEHSFAVTYRAWRGEPRGKHRQGQSWEGRGDCIDCKGCIAVCPTGIDIRDGQQLECIGCGLCIDACNEVMDKVGRPRGLIDFTTLAMLDARTQGAPPRMRLVRGRTLIYAGILVLVAAIMLTALALRDSVELTALRDRSPLFVALSDGAIRNGYTVKVVNKAREAMPMRITLAGLSRYELSPAGTEARSPDGHAVEITARADAVTELRLYVRAPRAILEHATMPITLRAETADGRLLAAVDTTFAGPAR